MRGRGTASIVASPVLVGAVTVLIVIVGVFLAYNANNGLPFVPTYELKAELPSGQKLVRGNEVRLGGFLVGTVTELTRADLHAPYGARQAHRFLASGDPDEFRRVGARFLGPEVGVVERRSAAVPVEAEVS